MWMVSEEVMNLSGKELSVGELDDIIEVYYEQYLEPKGFIKGNYRVYQHNDYYMFIKCHLIEKSSIIRKNKIKVGEIKTMKY